MVQIVTYRLAYLDRKVDLCDVCVDRDDHDRGSLGPVEHGQRSGLCQGKNHGGRGDTSRPSLR